MPNKDYVINARVRRVLARHWIEPSNLEVGTTDGVVVLKGRLALELEDGACLTDPLRCARVLRRLKADVAAIPGVHEVVMELS
jgi:hypothetical protein